MPKRRRITEGNSRLEDIQVQTPDKPETQEVKVEVTDPVIDHLKEIGALDVLHVCEDPLNPPMHFYIAIIVPKGRKVTTPIPALVKANRKSGYVRSMVPIPPNVFPKITEMYKEALVRCDRLRPEAERRLKELKLKQMLAKLSKEDVQLLKGLLESQMK